MSCGSATAAGCSRRSTQHGGGNGGLQHRHGLPCGRLGVLGRSSKDTVEPATHFADVTWCEFGPLASIDHCGPPCVPQTGARNNYQLVGPHSRRTAAWPSGRRGRRCRIVTTPGGVPRLRELLPMDPSSPCRSSSESPRGDVIIVLCRTWAPVNEAVGESRTARIRAGPAGAYRSTTNRARSHGRPPAHARASRRQDAERTESRRAIAAILTAAGAAAIIPPLF